VPRNSRKKLWLRGRRKKREFEEFWGIEIFRFKGNHASGRDQAETHKVAKDGPGVGVSKSVTSFNGEGTKRKVNSPVS